MASSGFCDGLSADSSGALESAVQLGWNTLSAAMFIRLAGTAARRAVVGIA